MDGISTSWAREGKPRADPEGENGMLEGVELTKDFGKTRALRGVTLGVEKGEVLILVGPNGAGKTTFLRLLAGRLLPTSGYVREGGREVDTSDPGYLRNLGYVPQTPSFYGRLTCRENLAFAASLYGLEGPGTERRVDEVLELMGLSSHENIQARRLSGGLAQRLNLAMGLLHDPDYLLLDEPTAGLDPAARRDLLGLLSRLAEEGGRGILFTTHILEEAEALGGRVAVLEEGRLLGVFKPGADEGPGGWEAMRRRWEGAP